MEDSVGSWEGGGGGSASAGRDDAACVVHRAAPVEEDDGTDAVDVSRSGGVLWIVVVAAVVAAPELDGAEILLVRRLSLPLLPRLTFALPGVGAAAAVANRDECEYSEASSPTQPGVAAGGGGAATSSDADDNTASTGAVLGGGKRDAATPSMTSTTLPPDTGAAAPLEAPAVDAEKSAILPIMYSDTARGSKEDSGSRMTPSSLECAKELSAAPVFAAEATAASEEGRLLRFRPPEGCRATANTQQFCPRGRGGGGGKGTST